MTTSEKPATIELTEENGPFCQSCAMPMQHDEQFGSNKNGSQNKDYCVYCYKDGAFTEPKITEQEMVDKVEGILSQMDMPKDLLHKIKEFIPTLKRWKK